MMFWLYDDAKVVEYETFFKFYNMLIRILLT